MIMASSITETEEFSGAPKSFLQHVRAMLAKLGVTSPDLDSAPCDWDAASIEALQQCAQFSEQARERREAIVQILQSADVSTKVSIADWLLFAEDINEAHDAIILRDQQQREAA
jgi:hypothetical protein